MSGSRRSLVTGGLGLIGAAVCARLVASGHEVVVLDNGSTGSPEAVRHLQGVRLVQGDIRRAADLGRLPTGDWEAVVHLAAQADVPRSVQHPQEDFAINAEGTLRLLEWCRGRAVGRFVYASTVAVYDPAAPRPLAEDAALGPISPYGASKLAGEVMVRAYAHSYGLPACVLRLFNVYGPRMTKYVIHDLVRKLLRNPHRLEVLGTGEQVRDYVHVDDAGQAFVLAATAVPPGAVLNVGSGEPVRIRDLAQRIIAVMGLKDVEVVFTGRSWAGDIEGWWADVRRLRALGWEPKVTLQAGLGEAVAWLRAQPGVSTQ